MRFKSPVHFFLALYHVILCVVCTCCSININLNKIIGVFYTNNIFKVIGICFYIFICLLVIFGSIAFFIGTIFHLIMFYYYAFFYKHNDREINITVDENYIIRDSFVELSNGRIIPIKIKKVSMGNPEEFDEEAQELGE